MGGYVDLLDEQRSDAPYGDVAYADPGYQADKRKRYPLDTKAHAQAAWAYINVPQNAGQYGAEDLAKVKAAIVAACRKFGINISEHAADLDGFDHRGGPPRDGLVRAIEGCEIRDAPAGDAGPGTLVGYLAVFGQWSEINSAHEGHFMERLTRGAFNRTIADNASRMKVTFNHGKDPQLGDKVLGIPTVLEEDSHGVRYEVPLLPTSYNRDLAPGLKAGAYGSSFRFNVTAEDYNKRAKASAYNPQGLPERTVRELRMQEFGPVTFPAYAGATAGMRSLTDRFYPPSSVQAVRTARVEGEEFLALIGG